MSWLSKFLKGGEYGSSDRRFTGHGWRPQSPEDENMVRHVPSRSLDDRCRPEREPEEIAKAIAQSLADHLNRPRGWREDSDSYFAREQDSGNTFADPPYVSSQYYPTGYRICGGCNNRIGYGNHLECMGAYFHPGCFRCHACGNAITGHEYSLSGRDPYHNSCFNKLMHPKCEVCQRLVPRNAAGLIEYRCHPFWSQKYCPSHDYDNTARCCSCERLETWNERYASLGDGRRICLECMEYSIMDTGDCQSLYHAIREFYEGLNMKLDQQIPVLLVERQALNEAIAGENNGFHHRPETRAACLFREQIVTIIQGSKIGSDRLVGMRAQPQKLTRKCEVTAILVLYGLPRLLMGSILACQLMYAWLRLNGYRKVDPEVEEGICQVVSHMWLESELVKRQEEGCHRRLASTSIISSGLSSASSPNNKKHQQIKSGHDQYSCMISSTEKKLGEFYLHKISNGTASRYGRGFGSASAVVNKYGLRPVLEHVRFSGRFPL